jgi:hypothetical protein
MYRFEVTGGTYRTVDFQPAMGLTMPEAVQKLLGAVLDVYEGDKLHRAEAQRAFEFWTPDEIRIDLETAGRCDIVLCGGHYVLTAKQED